VTPRPLATVTVENTDEGSVVILRTDRRKASGSLRRPWPFSCWFLLPVRADLRPEVGLGCAVALGAAGVGRKRLQLILRHALDDRPVVLKLRRSRLPSHR
jgi:hypothetical protein